MALLWKQNMVLAARLKRRKALSGVTLRLQKLMPLFYKYERIPGKFFDSLVANHF